DAGPLFATYRLAYEFTGGRKYSVDLIVRHNETFVTIDEHLEGFAPEDGVFFRFDLVPGFDPDRRDVMNNGGYNQYSGAFDKGAEGFLPFGTGEQRKGKLPLELGLNTPNSYGIMRSIAFYRDAGPHAMLLSLYRLRDWQTARRMVWYDTWGQSNLMFFCEDGHKYLLASLQGSERHWAMAIIPREAVVHTAITDKKSHTAGPEVRLWQKLSDFSLNKVKDMCFDWDESTQRQLSDGGEQITYDDWLKNYGMNAQYWFLNAIVNLYWDYSAITGPPSFRGMPRWYGDYDASRAAWTPEQRRHVRSILVWMAESCEDDNNIPHHGMMGGHPNFIMDVKHTIPIACAVLHDHPHAKQWRQSFQKFFDEWIATYQRDPDPEHNAIGGRWTENIACYSGTALVATLHCHKALRKFDGGRPGRTDLLDHPRIRSWIAWYLNAMMSPHEGVRLVPPEGAHSRALEPGNEHSYHSALFEIARLMKNSAPELSEQMRWIETNGREGTKPPLWSVLVADYGPVLRYDFGGPHESYLHLMQIAGPWNYRWGQGHSVLYYGAKNTACSHNTMEEAGDEWKFDNITSFTVGGRGLGRRATDQPLYDFGFAQFYRALAGDNSPCVARGMMLLRDDYIVLHDDVKGDAEGKLVWSSVYGFPQIYQLKPGARDPQGSPFTEATSTDPPPRPNAKPPRTARIRRYAGKGDFLTVVAPQPVKAEATPFGAVVNGNEFILCADANQRQDDGKLAFDGTFGYGREGQLALFEGTRIKLNGFGLRREGGDFGASADATGKGITGRVAGREGGTLCVTPPARLNSKNPKVTIDGRPVPCTMRDGEIRFDVTISLRDGCKEFEIQF
ncbi:MAG TPA: hypothetical protein VM223_11000, partial [Planctomycetota bacterium]|nr:hypothetical protein [Planctomycetota bacterium]